MYEAFHQLADTWDLIIAVVAVNMMKATDCSDSSANQAKVAAGILSVAELDELRILVC
jgi:hypothetical protein